MPPARTLHPGCEAARWWCPGACRKVSIYVPVFPSATCTVIAYLASKDSVAGRQIDHQASEDKAERRQSHAHRFSSQAVAGEMSISLRVAMCSASVKKSTRYRFIISDGARPAITPAGRLVSKSSASTRRCSVAFEAREFRCGGERLESCGAGEKSYGASDAREERVRSACLRGSSADASRSRSLRRPSLRWRSRHAGRCRGERG